jgi:hypothetical protein
MQGALSSLEMIRRCREEAHAIFVPMAYGERDRHNMEISFPSKLRVRSSTDNRWPGLLFGSSLGA